MLLYILIFSLAVICSILILWYFDPFDGFQNMPQSRFWDLVDKIDKKKDPATVAALAKVTDPDTNDENDPMPLVFSKYISIYALSQSPGNNWKVLNNQYHAGSDIKSVPGTIDQGKAACLDTSGH